MTLMHSPVLPRHLYSACLEVVCVCASVYCVYMCAWGGGTGDVTSFAGNSALIELHINVKEAVFTDLVTYKIYLIITTIIITTR